MLKSMGVCMKPLRDIYPGDVCMQVTVSSGASIYLCFFFFFKQKTAYEITV